MSSFVEEYRNLEAQAEDAESVAEEYRKRAEENRWEQCRIAYEAVESGEFSRRAFAEAVDKSDQTIGRQYRIWDEWSSTPASSRPTAQRDLLTRIESQVRDAKIHYEQVPNPVDKMTVRYFSDWVDRVERIVEARANA